MGLIEGNYLRKPPTARGLQLAALLNRFSGFFGRRTLIAVGVSFRLTSGRPWRESGSRLLALGPTDLAGTLSDSRPVRLDRND